MIIASPGITITLSLFLVSIWSFEANGFYLDPADTVSGAGQRIRVNIDVPTTLAYAINNDISLTFCANLNLAKKIGPFFFPVESKKKCLTVKRYAIGDNFIAIKDFSNKTTTHPNLDAVFDSMRQLKPFNLENISKDKFSDKCWENH